MSGVETSNRNKKQPEAKEPGGQSFELICLCFDQQLQYRGTERIPRDMVSRLGCPTILGSGAVKGRRLEARG